MDQTVVSVTQVDNSERLKGIGTSSALPPMVETDYLSEMQLVQVLDVNAESKLCMTSGFFCRLESHYLGCDIAPQVCLNELFQPSSQIRLYNKEGLLLSCDVLDSNKSSQVCFGWLTEVNINSLFMALCGISDIRRINGLKNSLQA